MTILISLPIFIALVILQAGVISRMPLLQGIADIVLLVIVAWSLQDRVKTAWQWSFIGGLIASFSTALPFGTLIVAYLATTGFSLMVRQRVWKAPILAMLFTTFIASIILYAVSYIAVIFKGVILPIDQVINLIVLPGSLLNLGLAIPAYIIVHELAVWLYPEDLET